MGHDFFRFPQYSLFRLDGRLWLNTRNPLFVVCSGILLLLHVGCSSQLYWAKPGAKPGDFDRDVVECRRSLVGGSGGVGALNPVIGVPQSAVDQCLSKKGWYLAKKPADVKPADAPAPPSN